MYTVTKGLNNNIVMARAEDGRECVLTGSGIGFRKSPGAPVLEQQIEHIYYGLDSYFPSASIQPCVPLQDGHTKPFGQRFFARYSWQAFSLLNLAMNAARVSLFLSGIM